MSQATVTRAGATRPAPAVDFPDDPVAAARVLAPVVEANRERMDAERRLSPPVVEGMQRIGALRMAVPRQLDGPEYDPLVQVELVEELSRLDGSVGWCAMIAAAASYVSGFLVEPAAQRWFGPPDACLAGQLAPTGRAVRVEGGYRASGRFRFASGCHHATMMIAGCLVHDERGEVILDGRGRPEVRSVIFRPSECEILDTWHTTGLWGTGSNDYVVDDLFVAEEDSWNPSGAMLRTEPLYRFPPLFLVPHCGVPLGIARAAVDALVDLAAEKDRVTGFRPGAEGKLHGDSRVQHEVALAETTLAAARALTYRTVAEVWETLVAGERLAPRLRALYRSTMAWTHQTARDIVVSMYDLAEGSSIYRSNPLDRQLRDILTACQHRVVHGKVYRPAGRLFLGLPSGDPLV